MKTQSKNPKAAKAKTAAKATVQIAPSIDEATKKAPPSRDTTKLAANSKPSSKHDKILTMLRKPNGATIAALMMATGWQAHSVRGFFSGVVRKKLGLQLKSEMIKDERRYRIVDAR